MQRARFIGTLGLLLGLGLAGFGGGCGSESQQQTEEKNLQLKKSKGETHQMIKDVTRKAKGGMGRGGRGGP
jgi:hypothetical protein